MKKTPVDTIPITLPSELEKLTRGAKIYDSSCSPEAKVYYISSGYYLKTSKRESLRREAEMDAYFHSLDLGPEVLYYGCESERDILLTREVVGEDCTHERYLSKPYKLAEFLGTSLRQLHSLGTASCPIQNKLGEYLELARVNYETGNYDKSHFPDSFGYSSADEAYKVMTEGRYLLKADTLIHGDFCLPNIIPDTSRGVRYIDLGNAGISDRHIDLFWGAWTLSFNLGTNKYKDTFFDAYGRDIIDEEKLKIIAAIEVFG